MRLASLVLFGLFLTTVLVLGQGAPNPPAKVLFDPLKYPEDWLLAKWEDAMSKVESLAAECQFTTIDTVFKSKDTYVGQAKYLKTKVATMASLELYKETKKGVVSKDSFQKYVCTGNFLYRFVPETKVIQVHEFSNPANGQGLDNNLLSFLFGMKAEDAKQRYNLTWKEPDANYFYLEIAPKQDADKKDFKNARLVFLKNFMVRQVWFVEPNGNAVIWEFPQAEVNAKLKATDFPAPQTPPGWHMEKAPALGLGNKGLPGS